MITLSVVVTVVDGGECLRRCLEALDAQAQGADIEIIVPYDQGDRTIAELARRFPRVRFHLVEDLGASAVVSLPSHAHRVIDRCRAVGLALATGKIVAMLEDRGVPAPDWCRQVVAEHDQSHAVIGGAIENGVDRAMNWALYYCDLGRYGLPRPAGPTGFLSDTNVAYKREPLASVHGSWSEQYQETTVHWALQARGHTLWFDPRLMTTQMRADIGWRRAYRERIDNARLFAETRVAAVAPWLRLVFVIGTPILPLLLLLRVARLMIRQGRSPRQMATALPLSALLVTGTAFGELLGYLAGPPRAVIEAAPRRAAAGADRGAVKS